MWQEVSSNKAVHLRLHRPWINPYNFLSWKKKATVSKNFIWMLYHSPLTSHFHSLFQVSPGSSLKNNWVEEIQEILKLGFLMSIFVCAITCTHAHCQSPWFYKKKPYEVTSSHIKMGWRIRIFNGIKIHKQPSTDCVSSKRFSSEIKAYFIFDFIQFQASAQNFYTPESIHQYFAGESKGHNNNIIAINNNNNNNTDLTTAT